MAITINGIVCQERVHQFQEEASLQGGFRARKGFLCAWSDRFTVARGLLGLSTYITIGAGITIRAPAAYPEPGIAAYCTSIDIEPIGSPTQGANQLQWPTACVWANYGVTPWSFGGLDYAGQIDPATPFTYADQAISSSCEWITLPGSGCKWKTSGKALQQGAGIRLTLVTMAVTLRQMAYMPSLQSVLYAGLINKYLYMGVSPGCLLYDGCETQVGYNVDGTRTQDATFKFVARSVRWDYQYDPAQKAFDQVQVGDTDNPGQWTSLPKQADFNYIIPTGYDAVPRYPIDPRPAWPPTW